MTSTSDLPKKPCLVALTDAEVTHAIAQHDYVGRSHRELSFKKNEALFLYRRLNADWWEGRSAERVTGAPPREGLIPEAYVTVLQAQTPNTPPPAGGSDLSSSGGATASPQPPPEGSGPERSGSPDEEEEEDEVRNSAAEKVLFDNLLILFYSNDTWLNCLSWL